MKRVRGFTLTDVIVTMIISLLITGIAFSIFRLTYNQLFSYQTDNEQYQTLFSFYTAIANDFRDAENITCKSESAICTHSPYKGDVEYEFTDQFIIRMFHDMTDTFNLKVTDFTPPCQQGNQSREKAEELSFVIELNGTHYPIQIFKNYPLELDDKK